MHRDVKPKNIMLTPDRVAKLADMGLAREMTDVEAAMADDGLRQAAAVNPGDKFELVILLLRCRGQRP